MIPGLRATLRGKLIGHYNQVGHHMGMNYVTAGNGCEFEVLDVNVGRIRLELHRIATVAGLTDGVRT